jgi:hypothetical protein
MLNRNGNGKWEKREISSHFVIPKIFFFNGSMCEKKCTMCGSEFLNLHDSSVNDEKFKIMELKERYICVECRTPQTLRLNVKRITEGQHFSLLKKNALSLIQGISYMMYKFGVKKGLNIAKIKKESHTTNLREKLSITIVKTHFSMLKKVQAEIRELFMEVFYTLSKGERKKVSSMIKHQKSFTIASNEHYEKI